MLTQTLSDQQILAYLDGEADAAVRDHLAGCPACRQRAAQLRQAEAQLRQLLSYTTTCPTSDELERYYLGELTSVQEAAIAAHLRRDCTHCQAAVATLMQTLADLGTPPVTDPSLGRESQRQPTPFAAFWAKLNAPVAAWAQQVKAGITLFVAELVPTPASALALRGAGDGLPLIYRTGDIEIRLDLQPELDTDRKVLVGQVKAPNLDLRAAEVQLRQAETTIAGTTLAGKHGRFQLPSLPPGDYTLVVRSSQWEVQIPHLHCP